MEVGRLRYERMVLFFYLAGIVCLTTTLALTQPLFDTVTHLNPPDEHARFLVPWYICETGKLPVGSEEQIIISGYGFSYALYNVFPYIIQGMGMRIANVFTRSELILLYVGRLMNVMNGILMAVVIYYLSKRLFRDRRYQWLFCFVVMYWPEVIFIHSYINTDSLCLLSTAIIVYALVCGYQEGFRRRDNIWLSVGIILCALSYYNAYGFILVSILLFASYFLIKIEGKRNWREMLRKGFFISGLVLLGIGWWFIRSGMLHDGDMLGLRTMREMKLQYSMETGVTAMLNAYGNSGGSIWEMLFHSGYLSCVVNSFIAAYGSLNIWGHAALYRLVKLCILAGGAGCVWQIISPDGESPLGENACRRRVFHAGMLGCILIPWLLAVMYSYYVDYQPQGRYVLIGIVPFVYYMIRGLQRLACGVLGKWCPRWLQNSALICVGCLFLGYSCFMIYVCALPVYLELGGMVIY